ncbi:hypothetical protein H2198_010265 [Neophaeococcomyces mojaviensis]|uniref:Uncharacterized protein n=1 Tax=Neophaeococcomyces mojaviensis TaxID=3383035 RepID=A0ACC2ZS52_9EURO|nr:hypothetical protein H2198_010265 [Knufia sp. JES_112]
MVTHQRRRRTLLDTSYSVTDHNNDPSHDIRDSYENLNSSITINTEEGVGIISPLSLGEKEKRIARRTSTISPSPTYRTFDTSLRNGARKPNPSLSALDEESVLDLATLHASIDATSNFPSRPTTATTIAPLNIFPHNIIHSRPISDLPSIPASLQAHLKELEDLRNGTIASNSAIAPTTPTTITPGVTLQNKKAVPCEITSSNTRNFKSSCALALHHTSTTISQLSRTHNRHSSSSTTLFHDHSVPAPARAIQQRPASDCLDDRRKSNTLSVLDTNIEKPAPAWCPNNIVKQAPLSADPAIKRLTEAWELMKRNSVQNRLSQFEFEFRNGTQKKRKHPRATTRLGDFEVDVEVKEPEAPVQNAGQENKAVDVRDLRQGKENISPSMARNTNKAETKARSNASARD